MRFSALLLLTIASTGCDSGIRRHYEIVQEELSDPDPKVRALAASHLTNLWGDDGKIFIPLLQKSLKDDNVLVRVQAARTICRFDPAQRSVAIPVLEEAADGEGNVSDDKSLARNLAIVALGGQGSYARSALPVLKKRLAGHSYERAIAAAALTQIDPSTYKIAFPILANCLNEGQSERVVAAWAFCRAGADAKDYLPSVRKLLEDDDEYVRSEVARALKSMGL